eukprot:5351566-Amphidinium_carterae.1
MAAASVEDSSAKFVQHVCKRKEALLQASRGHCWKKAGPWWVNDLLHGASTKTVVLVRGLICNAKHAVFPHDATSVATFSDLVSEVTNVTGGAYLHPRHHAI